MIVPSADAPLSAIDTTPQYSKWYRRWVLFLVLLVYIFGFIDRAVLSTVGQAVKQDLGMTDFQLGILGGVAFALCNALFVIPIARLAERKSRVVIISIALAFWSLMTAASAGAQNFWHLALARIGVGAGEAGGISPSQSLLSDYYPPHQRAGTIGIYMLGVGIGVIVGSVTTAWVAEHWGWRHAFLVVGIPGILLALLIFLTVKEPPRGHSEGLAPSTGPAPSLKAVVAHLWRKPSFFHLLAASTLVSSCGSGNVTFLHAYFVREYQLSYTEAAWLFGLINSVGPAVAYFFGGVLTDKLAKMDSRYYGWVPGTAMMIGMPLAMLGLLQASWQMAFAILLLPGMFTGTYFGPTYAAANNMSPPRMRATTASFLLFANLFGLAAGPALVGFISDLFTTATFTLGNFQTICPGGTNVDPVIADVCRASSARGIRYGLIVGALGYGWAGIHFFLASRTLRKDIQH